MIWSLTINVHVYLISTSLLLCTREWSKGLNKEFYAVHEVSLLIFIGHVAILEWLLHHSLASGVEQDDYGATPIHDAAEQGQLKCLHVFYSHSVDLNYRDCDGLTPL